MSNCNAWNNFYCEQSYSSTRTAVALLPEFYIEIPVIHFNPLIHCHDSCRVATVNLCQLRPKHKDCWTHKTQKMP